MCSVKARLSHHNILNGTKHYFVLLSSINVSERTASELCIFGYDQEYYMSVSLPLHLEQQSIELISCIQFPSKNV